MFVKTGCKSHKKFKFDKASMSNILFLLILKMNKFFPVCLIRSEPGKTYIGTKQTNEGLLRYPDTFGKDCI